MYSWTSWRTLVPLFIGIASLAGFIVWSRYFAREPILRASLFKSWSPIVSCASAAVMGMILWSILYYMVCSYYFEYNIDSSANRHWYTKPLYFEAVKQYNATKAGIALFPWTFTVGPTSAITGFVIAKTGHYRRIIWISWTLATIGPGLLRLFDVDTPTGEIWCGYWHLVDFDQLLDPGECFRP